MTVSAVGCSLTGFSVYVFAIRTPRRQVSNECLERASASPIHPRHLSIVHQRVPPPHKGMKPAPHKAMRAVGDVKQVRGGYPRRSPIAVHRTVPLRPSPLTTLSIEIAHTHHPLSTQKQRVLLSYHADVSRPPTPPPLSLKTFPHPPKPFFRPVNATFFLLLISCLQTHPLPSVDGFFAFPSPIPNPFPSPQPP